MNANIKNRRSVIIGYKYRIKNICASLFFKVFTFLYLKKEEGFMLAAAF